MSSRSRVGTVLLRSICRIIKEIDSSSSASTSKSLLSLNAPALQEDFQRLNSFKSSYSKWLAKEYSGSLATLKKCKPLLLQLRKINDGALSGEMLRSASKSVINDITLSDGDKAQIGFDMIRLLNEQLHKKNLTSWSENEEMGVRVCISTVGDRDNDYQDTSSLRYFYKVTVFNNSDKTYKLLGRHWQFYSGGELQQEVPKWGIGVLGSQPIILPGNAIEYTSCCTAGGGDSYMRGGLQFADISAVELPKELEDFSYSEDFNNQMKRWTGQGRSTVQLINDQIEFLQKTIDSLSQLKTHHEKIGECPTFECEVGKTSF